MNLRRLATVRAVALGLLALSSANCNAYDGSLLSRLSDGATQGDAGDIPLPYVFECGNGVLEEGEMCDTKIDEGQAGACPTSCPSDDPCDLRAMAGSECQTQCVGLSVTKAINDDDCCPPEVGPGEDSDCGTCGDGVTGPTETCEMGNCPTAAECGPLNACLTGVFSGDPETCSSACELVSTTTCTNDDGCCPAGCTVESDNDCSPSCGNGMLEPELGETCEVAPSAMVCPQTCDDGIACTHDVASGSVENCNVTCSNISFAAPADGDGCCPSGANALIDSDCTPACGNMVHESGETCDPCPTAADCQDSNACTHDGVTGSGCNAACEFTPITAPANGDGCCPGGANSGNDSDCPIVCGNGVTDAGEECDGGPLCRSCSLLFHSSLVHRYTFSGSGTTISDSVGTKHGTCVNCSVSNGAVDLSTSTSNNYVSFPAGLLSALSQVTFEVWLKWDGGTNRQHIVDFGCSSGGAGTSFFMLETTSGAGKLASYVNFTSATSDPVNDWAAVGDAAFSTSGVHHLAVTFSGTRLSLFLDGVRQDYFDGSATSLSLIDDCNNWLGRSQFSGDPELDAVIYEFRIYSQALSTSAVTASYNAGQNP